MIRININICGVGEMPLLDPTHSHVNLHYHGGGKDLAVKNAVEGNVNAAVLGQMLTDFVREVEEYKTNEP